jgi:hypothetical protein
MMTMVCVCVQCQVFRRRLSEDPEGSTLGSGEKTNGEALGEALGEARVSSGADAGMTSPPPLSYARDEYTSDLLRSRFCLHLQVRHDTGTILSP